MASANFLNLAQQVARRSRRRLSLDADILRCKEAVNEAYLATLATGDPYDVLEMEGQWLTSASAETYTYAGLVTGMGITGAGIQEVHSLTMDDPSLGGYVLESMSWEALERLTDSSVDGEPLGQPYCWAKWSDRLRLYPQPDATYPIGALVRLSPIEMVNDGDVPLIPLAWCHRLLVTYGAAILLEQEGGAEALAQARYYRDLYREAFREFRTAHATAKRPTFRVMSPAFGADLPGGSDG